MDVNRDEERKIAEIFKERKSTQNSDNRSEKVDFLYKDKVDSEEYLLGKRVDTHFERQNIPQGSQSNVGAKFDEDPFLHNERLNTQIKQREDPLSAMRKKEEDARRALLNNPLKMKLLEKELKERRKKRRSKDGDELLARLMAIKGGKVNAKPVKAKRKLPDDDQSLLYRCVWSYISFICLYMDGANATSQV
ncbi:CWC25 [Bugula neritina]|uniref:CWC25 n=1 Tax=Bugula neritina TaxID=10212 RepID=A0A7J7K1Y4_BUGNE|nr:CWC25 [Bugula neritina]